MKKYPFIVWLSLLMTTTMSSCWLGDLTETVYGEGNVITKERDVTGFSKLHVSSGIDVYLRQDEQFRVVVEADENLHEYIHTELRGEVLNVGSRVNIRRAQSKTVFVSAPDITGIKISSSGDVTGESLLKTRVLNIDISSAGNLSLEVEAEELYCSLSSSGDARLAGSARSMIASMSSAGDLYAFDLVVETCRLNVSSAGNARVHVTGELTANASSAGDIYYMGEPQRLDINTSSAGSVHKR